jgi:hypothetical protein
MINMNSLASVEPTTKTDGQYCCLTLIPFAWIFIFSLICNDDGTQAFYSSIRIYQVYIKCPCCQKEWGMMATRAKDSKFPIAESL